MSSLEEPSKLRFAVIDKYDTSTKKWSKESLSRSRRGIAVAAINGFVVWGGGEASNGPSNGTHLCSCQRSFRCTCTCRCQMTDSVSGGLLRHSEAAVQHEHTLCEPH